MYAAEITNLLNLLNQAQMDPVMVADQITNFDAPGAINAARAAATAHTSPAAGAKALKLAQAWMDANPAEAVAIIQARIDARDAAAQRPLSDAATAALNCRD